MVSGGAGSSTSGSGNGGAGMYQYPLLTSSNYTGWVIRVQAIMEDQGIWAAIQPTANTTVDLKLDRKAKAHILRVLPEDLLMQVAKKNTLKEIWESLKTRFVGTDRVKNSCLQVLKSDFSAMRMTDGETLDQYAGRITTTSVQYSNVGGTLEESAMVKKFYDTVPDKYLPIIAGVEQFCNLEEMSFEEAVSRLKAYEDRTRSRTPGGGLMINGQLLLSQGEWQSRQKKGGDEISSNQKGKTSADGKNRCKTHDRGSGRGGRGNASHTGTKGGYNNGVRDKSHIRCYNCDEMGHYSTQCKVSSKKKIEANLAQSDTEPALLLTVSEEMSYNANALSQQELMVPLQDSRSPVHGKFLSQQDCALLNEDNVWPELHQAYCAPPPSTTWYLDNGGSNHTTGDRNKFQNLD